MERGLAEQGERTVVKKNERKFLKLFFIVGLTFATVGPLGCDGGKKQTIPPPPDSGLRNSAISDEDLRTTGLPLNPNKPEELRNAKSRMRQNLKGEWKLKIEAGGTYFYSIETPANGVMTAKQIGSEEFPAEMVPGRFRHDLKGVYSERLVSMQLIFVEPKNHDDHVRTFEYRNVVTEIAGVGDLVSTTEEAFFEDTTSRESTRHILKVKYRSGEPEIKYFRFTQESSNSTPVKPPSPPPSVPGKPGYDPNSSQSQTRTQPSVTLKLTKQTMSAERIRPLSGSNGSRGSGNSTGTSTVPDMINEPD